MTADVLAAYKAPPLSPKKRIKFKADSPSSATISNNVLAEYLSRLNTIQSISGDNVLPVVREGLYDDFDLAIGSHTSDEGDE
jgi:hypothetical protein